MKSLAIMAQKGGAGKTTIAVHLAVAAAEDGAGGIAILDADRQGSALAWFAARAPASRGPSVERCASAARLAGLLAAFARQPSYAFAIIDTAPRLDAEAAQIAAAVDFILIPCRPAAFDFAALESSTAIARASGKPAAFVLSACPRRAPEIAETRAALAGYGYPVAPGIITDRRAFARAVASGRAVTEFDPGGAAADEIRALWQWLKEEIRQ